MRYAIAILCITVGAACGGGGGGDPDAAGVTCGNLVIDPGEVCDDGNRTAGDGCAADCGSDETCGNQVTDVAIAEVCDDGNALDGDGCSADCRSDETCGNGVIDAINGETCDDANSVAADGCSANCQSNEECGNSYVDANEYCDTGGVTAACDADCTMVRCGDGTRNGPAGEQCDDGDTDYTDACTTCRNAYCGDGHVWAGQEQCDGGSGCTASCTLVQPVMYVISVDQLIGKDFECDGTLQNWYGYMVPIGIRWNDTGAFTPSSVSIELNRGIICDGGVSPTYAMTLNGSAAGSLTWPDPGTACACTPPEQVFSITLSGGQLAGYLRGGTNTYVTPPTTSSTGLSYSEAFGGYARVTVYP